MISFPICLQNELYRPQGRRENHLPGLAPRFVRPISAGWIFLFENIPVGSCKCSTCVSLKEMWNSFLLNVSLMAAANKTKSIISQISTMLYKLLMQSILALFFSPFIFLIKM